MDEVDITIDLDGVCVDTYGRWADLIDATRLEVYQHKYGGRRGPVHDKIYGRNGEEGVYRRDRELQLRQEYDTIPGALETLLWLDDQGHSVAYLTSRRDAEWQEPPGTPGDHTSRYELSAEWLQHHGFPQPRIIGARNKGHVAAAVGAKAHIDDSLRHVKKVNRHGLTGVLFDPVQFHTAGDVAEHYTAWDHLGSNLSSILGD